MFGGGGGGVRELVDASKAPWNRNDCVKPARGGDLHDRRSRADRPSVDSAIRPVHEIDPVAAARRSHAPGKFTVGVWKPANHSRVDFLIDFF